MFACQQHLYITPKIRQKTLVVKVNSATKGRKN